MLKGGLSRCHQSVWGNKVFCWSEEIKSRRVFRWLY